MSQAEMAIKLKSGFLLLAGRSAFTKILQVFSSLILAYKLVPADYGSFGIIYGFLSSLIFFTDIGLGDVLIQKKDPIKAEELSSYIGIRLCLGLLGMAFFMAIYPFLTRYYHFDFIHQEYVILLALILPLEAFIGAAIVEVQKNLHFKELAKIELYETFFLYSAQVLLAFLNFGIWSFFIAILFSRVLKTFLCLKLLKFNVMPGFNLSVFKGKYRNGLYFQLNSIIPTSKAMLLPVILALYLDIHTIGIIFWTTSLVSIPLVLAYNYNSILFPALSKFQDNQDSARELASHSMEKMILMLAFVFGLGGIVGDQIIALVFNNNWADAKSLVFVCALYHLSYSIRFMCYPILYAKNLASRRTLGELLMVLLEYLCVYLFCKNFQALGYFVSLIGINLLAFYFFTHFAKDWLRPFTMLRFHLVFFGILLCHAIEKLVNLPQRSVTSLSIEALAFSLLLTLFMMIFDIKFRELVFSYIKRFKNHAV